jgi:hypothetical protein
LQEEYLGKPRKAILLITIILSSFILLVLGGFLFIKLFEKYPLELGLLFGRSRMLHQDNNTTVLQKSVSTFPGTIRAGLPSPFRVPAPPGASVVLFSMRNLRDIV